MTMRNINTWLLFVFLVYLATTGGKENHGEEVEEEVAEELEEEILRLEAPDDDDDDGDRERRGLYGGTDKEDVCPKQCLCLSEIQVINNSPSTRYSLNRNISQVLCNTGNLTKFPRKLPNVTQDISITNQQIKMIPKYVSHQSQLIKSLFSSRKQSPDCGGEGCDGKMQFANHVCLN